MNMKRVRMRDSRPSAQSLVGEDRMQKIGAIMGCLLIIMLLASPRAQAAELDCLVKPEMYVELSSPVDSVMEEILVETGDTVTRGQPLAQMEASVERAKVKLARMQAMGILDRLDRLVTLLVAGKTPRRQRLERHDAGQRHADQQDDGQDAAAHLEPPSRIVPPGPKGPGFSEIRRRAHMMTFAPPNS